MKVGSLGVGAGAAQRHAADTAAISHPGSLGKESRAAQQGQECRVHTHATRAACCTLCCSRLARRARERCFTCSGGGNDGGGCAVAHAAAALPLLFLQGLTGRAADIVATAKCANLLAGAAAR